ncbi:MAG: MBL fold metallo-hydrolase, partial [Desulfobacterales bacterium]|nr:MBL fold metallo-hydrolase [Desulfobacterales bacterium]
MKILFVLANILSMIGAAVATAQQAFETDTLQTSAGDLKITFLGHGTLMLNFGGKIIHVDPYGDVADYTKLPKADLILITHEHRDHLDVKALGPIRKDKTVVVANPASAKQTEVAMVMKNGDVKTVEGFKIEAVPAYNIVHKRDTGEPFHPKGDGNGYVITFGDKRVYIAA